MKPGVSMRGHTVSRLVSLAGCLLCAMLLGAPTQSVAQENPLGTIDTPKPVPATKSPEADKPVVQDKDVTEQATSKRRTQRWLSSWPPDWCASGASRRKTG